jgi:type IV pilus assembly protein PilM
MLGTDRILALDIGAATVKVGEFQASKTHGLRLTNFNYADLGIDPEHEENRKALIVSTVRNVLREKGIRPGKVIFSVSGQSVFTRFVKLPPVDESKVVQIIQYEAQQNVPFPIDEVIWDYQLIGSSEQGELEVVLLAIKSDIIEDLNDGVESAGLRTEMVDVAPMALCNAVRYNQGDVEGCTVILDIGARTTNLLFLEKSRVFSRSIPIAGNAISQSIAAEFNVPFRDAEQLKRTKGFVALGGAYEEPGDEQQARISKIIRNVMTRLHAEVTRSVNFYKGQQGGSPPQRLLLAGGSSIIPYTDRFFQEKLQIPIEYFNPFRNVEIAPNIAKEELSRSAHFLGEVVGLGLRRLTECPLEVNLLPRSIRARKQVQAKQPFILGAAVCLLLVPLCWLAYTQKTSSLKQRELADVRQEVDRLQRLDLNLKDGQAQLSKVKGEADRIVTVVKQRSLWPELLNDLNQRVPQNLWITALLPQTTTGGAGGTTPAAPGGRFLRGRTLTRLEEEAAANEATPQTGPSHITEIAIDGGGPHTAEDLKLVDEFANNLRQSPFYDKTGVDIEKPPSAMGRETTFTFTIRAKLLKPIAHSADQ